MLPKNGTYFVIFLSGILFCKCEFCPKKCTCQQRIVQCSGKKLTEIPRNIPSRVSEQIADDNFISELPAQVLQGGDSLLSLNLSHNVIQSLSEDNFQLTPALTYIDLSYNNLTCIQGNVFRGLTDLQTLILTGNRIASLSPQSFRNLTSLRDLKLSYNKIRALPIDIFTSLSNLKTLSLDGNKISIIPDELFRALPSLITLNLSRNRIRRVTINTFKGLKSLQELRLDRNKIQNMDEHLPEPDITCDTKVMGNYSISEAMQRPVAEEGVLSNLRDLRLLDIQYNLLREIKISSFQGLKHLRNLILGENKWRCNCVLKLTIQSLRYYLHNEEIWLGDIHCAEPDRIKNVNLDDLSIEDLKSVEKTLKEISAQMTTTESIIVQVNRKDTENKWHKKTIPINPVDASKSGNHKTSLGRPQNDLVTLGREIDSKEKTLSKMPPTGSLIPVFQTGDIEPTTSYHYSNHGNAWTTGVRSVVRNVVPQLTLAAVTSKDYYPTAHGESPYRNDGDVSNHNLTDTKISKKKESKEGQTILLAIVIALSFLAVFAVAVLISVKHFKNRDKNSGCCLKTGGSKKNSSLRSVTTYPLLYDNHHVARRPLPKAPSFNARSRPTTSEEVRWTNGGVYGLGSNRSSFISLHSQSISNNNSFDTALTTLQSDITYKQDGFSKSSTTRGSNSKLQHSQRSRSSLHSSRAGTQGQQPVRRYGGHQNLLASFKNSNNTIQRSNSALNESQSTLQSRREKMEARRLRRQKRRSLVRPESAIISTSIREVNERPRALPPVPRRTSVSKNRCQQLKNQQKNITSKSGINWSHNAYCEIDPGFPIETSEFVENILYRKHIAQQKVDCSTVTEKLLTESTISPDVSEFTKRICDRLVQLHSATPDNKSNNAGYNKQPHDESGNGECVKELFIRNGNNSTEVKVESAYPALNVDSPLITAGSKEKLDKLYNELIQDMKENELTRPKPEKLNGYDKLEFCTSGESASEKSCKIETKSEDSATNYDTTSDDTKKKDNCILQRKNSSDSLFVDMSSVCDSITTEDDMGSIGGEEDFEIFYPIVESRRTYPLGAYGSDQYILDSLRNQEEDAKAAKEQVHHTAPGGLEHLTVPLSEISTDDDDSHAHLRHQVVKKSRNSSSGSLATVLSKTPDVKNDAFVYTMAGESTPDSLPEVFASNEKFQQPDSGYETVKVNDNESMEGIDENVLGNDHRYQHIQYMYSGHRVKDTPLNDVFLHSSRQETGSPPQVFQQYTEDKETNKLLNITANKKNERHYHFIDFDNDIEKTNNQEETSFNGQTNAVSKTAGKRHRLYHSIDMEASKNAKKLIPFPQNVPNRNHHYTKHQIKDKGKKKSTDKTSTTTSQQKAFRKDASNFKADENAISTYKTPMPNNQREAESMKSPTQKTSCLIKLDHNKNPVVHMTTQNQINCDSIGITQKAKQKPSNIIMLDHIEHRPRLSTNEKLKRSSKVVGYFEPVESSPDEVTDEEVFDLGTL
ncbi:uncharacterized protein LOC144429519 [Styela clava]